MTRIAAGFDLGEFTESSHLLCAITTLAGRVLWANATIGRAFGPEAGAVVNRPVVELLDPHDRSLVTRELTRLDTAGDEVAFLARLHPMAGGFRASWSGHLGADGLVYLVGAETPDPAELQRPPSPHGTELRDLLTRDHLTRTANRRAFDDALQAQLDRCRRESVPLTVALVDLDRFKLYNDTFGHLEGDQCLVTVADAILQRTSREGELVGRFGGDEFLVLWPVVDAATALRNADNLREAVRVLDLRPEGEAMEVTVSIGGITVVPTAATTASALVDAADRAMYSAKRSGGNAVRWVTDVDRPDDVIDLP